MTKAHYTNKFSCLFLSAAFCSVSLAQEAPAPTLAELMALVNESCPVAWEPTEAAVDLAIAPQDVWEGDAPDKQAFIDYMEAIIITQGW